MSERSFLDRYILESPRSGRTGSPLFTRERDYVAYLLKRGKITSTESDLWIKDIVHREQLDAESRTSVIRRTLQVAGSLLLLRQVLSPNSEALAPGTVEQAASRTAPVPQPLPASAAPATLPPAIPQAAELPPAAPQPVPEPGPVPGVLDPKVLLVAAAAIIFFVVRS